ncbi:ABC transporter substrate-binding protein [Bogoriella caseilytica]|uniref:Peptide/nickel transport system substrate-binding protein n=1 Tax=Bogoriella caseilytica TaxID=56055 RepID=A0A3N2BDG8_9MICO|nr:ABC transporter substrate-binding protein [Bogoriella caseilytica]ROR73303.1 peptide/nickel transport system substrate-binding protein [Bogoriella caseilytica]
MPQHESTPPTPDLLRYGATLPISRIDPLCGLWNEASSLVFSRPFAVNEHGVLEPDVAVLLETAPDGLHWAFGVREGVTWHDGEPVTVEDLALSLRLVSDPRLRGEVKQHIAEVTDVRVDGPHVVVTLSRRMPALLHTLSKTCIVPSHRFSSDELSQGALDRDPIGSGPYRVVERSDQACRFVRHDRFHHGSAALKRIEMVQIAEDRDRAAALAAGEIDLAQIKAQHVDTLTEVPDVVVHPIATRVWRALTFSLTHPLLRDPSIRRALSTLIDREEVVSTALGGYGLPQYYPTPPSSWASPPAPPATGPELARQQLLEAGCELNEAGIWERDGVPLELTFAYLATETFRAVASEVIAAQFARAGVPVSLTPITWRQYQAMDATGLRDSGYDGIVVGWSGGVDPHENLAIRYSTNGAYNRDGYSNPELDRLLDEAVNAPDRPTAVELYRRISRITVEDSIMAPLANPQYLFAARRDLSGFEDFEVDSFYEFPQYAHRIARSGAHTA